MMGLVILWWRSSEEKTPAIILLIFWDFLPIRSQDYLLGHDIAFWKQLKKSELKKVRRQNNSVF